MALLLILAMLGRPTAPAPDRSGAEVFATICSMCHIEETPGLRAPSIAALRRLTRQNITDALTLGAMTDIGNALSDQEIEAVADFLTTAPVKAAPSTDKD